MEATHEPQGKAIPVFKFKFGEFKLVYSTRQWRVRVYSKIHAGKYQTLLLCQPCLRDRFMGAQTISWSRFSLLVWWIEERRPDVAEVVEMRLLMEGPWRHLMRLEGLKIGRDRDSSFQCQEKAIDLRLVFHEQDTFCLSVVQPGFLDLPVLRYGIVV